MTMIQIDRIAMIISSMYLFKTMKEMIRPDTNLLPLCLL